MSTLPLTHKAILELLDILRCDSCSNALHESYTTGACEHLLCGNCIPSRKNGKKSNMCPICSIPIHPLDCRLNTQLNSLVLVARRLKKLTFNEGYDNSESNDEQNEKKIELNNSNANDVVTKPVVLLKRAYSSSTTTLSQNISEKSGLRARWKRSHSANQDSKTEGNVSLSSRSCTISSINSSVRTNSSVTYRPHYKPALGKGINQCSNSKVANLPAYPSVKTRKASKHSSSISLTNMPQPLTDMDKTIEPLSESVITNNAVDTRLPSATNVRKTRKSLKKSKVPNDSYDVAPVASPEPSRLTDLSSRSLIDQTSLKTSIFLTPIDVHNTEHKLKDLIDEKSPTSNKASKKRQETKCQEIKKESRHSFSKSLGISNLINKLRPNSKGESLLHRAAIRGDINQIEELLSAKLSPNIRDHAGWTPLHEAALRGHCTIGESLLKAGAKVDIPGGPDLETPLHEAIQNYHVDFCQLLIEYNANPLFANVNGLTPIQLVDNLIYQFSESNCLSNGKLDKKSQNVIKNKLSKIREILNNKSVSDLLSSQISSSTEKSLNYLSASSATSFIERRRLRPVLLGTGLTRTQQSLFAKVAAMIHARVVTSISSEVTHVVTGALQELAPEANIEGLTAKSVSLPKRRRNSGNSKNILDEHLASIGHSTCPRTLKFLNAILQGCWILSFDWIETCAHVKMRVEEEGFEVTGCSTAPMSGAPRRARLAKEAGSLGLFYGLRVCFLGEFFYPVPSRDELTSLARSGGATVIFSRGHCSPLRLAKLAIESTNSQSYWNLNLSNKLSTKEIDHDSDVENQNCSFIDDSIHVDKSSIKLSNYQNNHILHVFYDPGTIVTNKNQLSSNNNNSNNNKSVPYPMEVVTKALQLIKPNESLPDQNETKLLPLKLITCTWLLDCVAEYRLLPYPTD